MSVAWSIDHTPVKVLVSLVLLANGLLIALGFAAELSARQIGAAAGRAVGAVIVGAIAGAAGQHVPVDLSEPGYDMVDIALNVATWATLVFFLGTTILLWTKFRFYRVGALIAAIAAIVAYSWYIVFEEVDNIDTYAAGSGQVLAHLLFDAGLVLLAAATLVAIVRATPRASARPSAPAHE
jgi:hypothetical protein